MMVRVFANGLGDLGSIPGWVIPKTQKMVLDASLPDTRHYKVNSKNWHVVIQEIKTLTETDAYKLMPGLRFY